MKIIQKNKIIKYLKLILILLVIILMAFSQIFETREASNASNKLSPRDAWVLTIYIFGIIFIPVIIYCMSKLKKNKY